MGEKRRGFDWELTASVVGPGTYASGFGAASSRQADWGGVRYFLRQQQDFCCQVERLRVLLEASPLQERRLASASAGRQRAVFEAGTAQTYVLETSHNCVGPERRHLFASTD